MPELLACVIFVIRPAHVALLVASRYNTRCLAAVTKESEFEAQAGRIICDRL